MRQIARTAFRGRLTIERPAVQLTGAYLRQPTGNRQRQAGLVADTARLHRTPAQPSQTRADCRLADRHAQRIADSDMARLMVGHARVFNLPWRTRQRPADEWPTH